MIEEPKCYVGKVVRVTWRDPRGASGWQEKAVAFIPPSTCVTWGRCLRDDVEGFVVASSVSFGDAFTGELVGDVMSIPTSLIEEVKVLKNG